MLVATQRGETASFEKLPKHMNRSKTCSGAGGEAPTEFPAQYVVQTMTQPFVLRGSKPGCLILAAHSLDYPAQL